MNSKILLTSFVASILLISCSSSKRMAQTVDDLYYSPTPELVKQEKEDKEEKEIEEQREENFLRNKVRNRNRWNRIDDFDYWNDTRYTFNHCGCNNTFTNWNTYYNGWVNPYINVWAGSCGSTWNNPYFTFVPYVAPIKPVSYWSNIKSFNNHNYNNNNANMTFNPKGGYNNNNNNNNTATGNTKTSRPNNNGGFFNNAIRVFTGGSTPSSNAGGNSGGFKSSGSSSSSTPRAGRSKN